MDKIQAAKLAQAYQWLSEGKEVECTYPSNGGRWQTFDGDQTRASEFRLKPEPAKLEELWVNQYGPNCYSYHISETAARASAGTGATRIAVHLREVREPDIKAMVDRFMKWKLAHQEAGICMTHEQAEQMIRHILGEDQ